VVVVDAPGAEIGIVLGNFRNFKMKLNLFIGEVVFPFANQVVFVVIEVDGLVVVEQGGDVVAVDVGARNGGIQALDFGGVGEEDDSVGEQSDFVVRGEDHLPKLGTVIVAAPIGKGFYLTLGEKENTDGGNQYGRKDQEQQALENDTL
jgi:hypothetical protein